MDLYYLVMAILVLVIGALIIHISYTILMFFDELEERKDKKNNKED